MKGTFWRKAVLLAFGLGRYLVLKSSDLGKTWFIFQNISCDLTNPRLLLVSPLASCISGLISPCHHPPVQEIWRDRWRYRSVFCQTFPSAYYHLPFHISGLCLHMIYVRSWTARVGFLGISTRLGWSCWTGMLSLYCTVFLLAFQTCCWAYCHSR